MARADLLLKLVEGGARGDSVLFQTTLEALVAEERAKQHHILADRLAAHLVVGSPSTAKAPLSAMRRNGTPSDLLHELKPSRSLDDLVLSQKTVKACQEVIEEYSRADLLRAHNLEPRHRILLTGPPGNGKTSLAEALATELALPLLSVRYEAVITSYLGETALRLAQLFDYVRARRCVLFFDEFDVVGKERGDIHETGEIKRVVSSLLVQIDRLPSHVVVITATNHPELLDRAVWRRFQLRLELAPPSPALARDWFHRFANRLGASIGYKPETLARRLKGLSYSELEQFSLDVQRQYVLNLPGGDVREIISDRLKQLPGPSASFVTSGDKEESSDAQ